MRAPLTLIPALLFAGLVGGCVSQRGGDPFRERGDRQLSLTVENHEFNQATIYAIHQGVPRRLGIVEGNSEKTFRTDWTLPYMSVRVVFLGGGGFETESQDVAPGDELYLLIDASAQTHRIR